MPEFNSRKDVEYWLKTRQPEEISLFATRGVLRALPAIALDGREKVPAAWLLPLFRAMTRAWLAAKWPSLSRPVAYTYSHVVIYNPKSDGIVPIKGHAASVVLVAGDNAAQTSTSTIHNPGGPMVKMVTPLKSAIAARAPDDVADAIASVTPKRILRAFKAANAAAIAADKAALENGKTVPELAAMPLWPGGTTPEVMTGLWGKLKSRLPETENWDVWTDWYEDRLRGSMPDRELEKTRVLIPDEDWGRGPAHVNAIVKRSMDEIARTGKMPEPETFSDWENIQAWLETREQEESILFIGRTLLRVLPAFGMYKREYASANRLLLLFRMVSVPWFGGTWPTSNPKVSAAAASANAGLEAANEKARDDNLILEVLDFFRGSDDRETMVAEIYYNIAKTIAPVTSDNILHAFKAASAAAISADKRALERGATVAELSAMPLWPNGETPEAMATFWESLKSRLPEGEDWNVWTEWYEARLRGTPSNEELEQARVLIPDDDWKQGSAHVNAIIKRLIDEHQGFDFENLRKIAANAETPRLGSPEELKARAEVEERAEAVEAALPESPEYGGIGHNRPPEEIQLRKDDLSTARESVAAIREEAQAESPGIERVAKNASVLKRVVGWVAEKLDMTVNAFCKAFGATLGRVAAVGISAAIVLPPYWGKLATLLESVWNWLRLVLG